MNVQSNMLLSTQQMFPEHLLRAGVSITARGEVTAALEEMLHRRAPHWDKCMDSHGKDCNR